MTPQPQAVYWDTLQHHAWTLYVAATDRGLCYITLPNESMNTFEQWVAKHLPGAILVQDERRVQLYKGQVAEYLKARRTDFTLPLDLRGTPFQVRVWRALTQIPFGTTRSYADIAQSIGQPTAVRAVGAANGANPIPIVIPCHRVIGKNGALTGYRGGMQIKAKLLELEDRSTRTGVKLDQGL